MEQIYIPKQNYKVLVRTITYNQAKYITDTLDGVAMQQTNFPFVHYVIDDCSTDGEQEVIKSWLNGHCDMTKAEYIDLELANVILVPHKTNTNLTFAIYLLKRNLWKEPELKGTLVRPWRDHCEYEAICEGDDYWTHSGKLQKQVDILEKDPSLMLCCTNCREVDSSGHVTKEKREFIVPENKEGKYNLRQYFEQKHSYPTLSVVYRGTHAKEVREKFQTIQSPYLGDWNLFIALMCFGDAYYLDVVTCSYHVDPNSLTHNPNNMWNWIIGRAKDEFRLQPLIATILPDDLAEIKYEKTHNKYILWYDLAMSYRYLHAYRGMMYAFLRCMLSNPIFMVSKLLEALIRRMRFFFHQ